MSDLIPEITIMRGQVLAGSPTFKDPKFGVGYILWKPIQDHFTSLIGTEITQTEYDQYFDGTSPIDLVISNVTGDYNDVLTIDITCPSRNLLLKQFTLKPMDFNGMRNNLYDNRTSHINTNEIYSGGANIGGVPATIFNINENTRQVIARTNDTGLDEDSIKAMNTYAFNFTSIAIYDDYSYALQPITIEYPVPYPGPSFATALIKFEGPLIKGEYHLKVFTSSGDTYTTKHSFNLDLRPLKYTVPLTPIN